MLKTDSFKETVVLVDADFVDGVAFDLTVNFERMLMRRIPKADLPQWLVCVALDGGLLPEEGSALAGGETQVVFLHQRAEMQNFRPGRLAEDIDGQAFSDSQLGEFLMSSVRREPMAGDDFFVECTEALLGSEETKTLILVPDMEKYGAELKGLLAREGRKKQVTLLAMQPEAGRGFQSEILGYSLMHAMGIRGEELER